MSRVTLIEAITNMKNISISDLINDELAQYIEI